MADIIEIEILEDGTVSIQTSSISEVNHVSADELLDEITYAIGKEVTRKKRSTGYFNDKAVLRGGKIVQKVR